MTKLATPLHKNHASPHQQLETGMDLIFSCLVPRVLMCRVRQTQVPGVRCLTPSPCFSEESKHSHPTHS